MTRHIFVWKCDGCGWKQATDAIEADHYELEIYETPDGWYEVAPLGKVPRGVPGEYKTQKICPRCYSKLFGSVS